MRWRSSRPRYTKVSGDHPEKWSLIKIKNHFSKYELQLIEAMEKYYREKIEYAANSLKENSYNRIMAEKSHIDRTARARNKIGFLRRIFGPPPPKNPYTAEEMERLNQLKKALESLDYKNFNKPPSNEMCVQYQKLIDALKPILAKKEEEEAKNEEEKYKIRVKRSQEKAIIASARGKTREAANYIKRDLKQQIIDFPYCPYCNNHIGKKPHCDHIHPVSHGGLSTYVNMVYICYLCNIKKKDLTLREFIERNGFNRIEIENRLLMIGKRI